MTVPPIRGIIPLNLPLTLLYRCWTN